MKFLLMVTTLLLAFSISIKAQNELSYDGYYVSTPDSNTLDLFKYYLRFYPDGTVIGVNTAGKPDNLIPWFKKENKTPYVGKYEVSGGIIKFSMISEQGQVVYNGKLMPDNRMLLLVKSMINKYEGKEEYSFMRMEKIK